MFYQAESELGLNFLKTLPAHNESLVFSPISIALVLSLVHAGARGNSKKQIEDTLLNKAVCNNCQFINHFSGIAKNLKKGINGVEVNMANRLYLRQGSTAKRQFLASIIQNYGAEARALDFRTFDAVQKINGYVKTATKGKVDRIINNQDSIKNSKGLLINALSFKAAWEEGFPISSAFLPFELNSFQSKAMDSIKDFTVRGYSTDEYFRVLTLKFKDPRYQFSIFLPKQKHGLNEALKKLDNRRFENLLNTVKSTHLLVEIPKFNIDRRLSLKNSLKAIGITEIFSDFADLSGITDDAKISEGIHKATFQINEAGTSSGFAKPAEYNPVRTSGQPIEFKANHPFLFTVTYMNQSIFMGVFRG
ncbi:hypothetical protein CAEBREN_09512 [Caenorhabditis brenneri]|uniref:Serpin domain-containing protein n=1 Tax=Caenorhabditis brenneri TaxID=135651 RepID=G0NEJ2_CAEBE|nr:hypothetical protein CAEBREN_09512 [Caenorhabditis brenneri]